MNQNVDMYGTNEPVFNVYSLTYIHSEKLEIYSIIPGEEDLLVL